MKIRFWENARGDAPVLEFIRDIRDNETRDHIQVQLKKIECLVANDFLCSKHVRPVRHLYEFKVPFKKLQFRFFFVVTQDVCVLLHACLKKTQKTERRDIELAITRTKFMIM